jgi:hypothetical protein
VTKRDPTAAERMRRCRARKKAAGLTEIRRWVGARRPAPFSDHRIHEIRSLAMHAVIARKLLRDRRILELAKRNLTRWRKRRAGRLAYLAEWAAILRRPPADVAAFLVSLDEDAIRLRQSSPFAGALTQEERRRFFDAFGTGTPHPGRG